VITVIEYRYHSSWWYWYSTVRDISDNCDRVQTVSGSPRWVIPVLYHSYHLCLLLLYQYHQDKWYLYSITVITYVSFTVQSTGITHLGDTDTVVRDIGDNCDRVQVSLILELSPMSLLLYCISITKISDTCTLSHWSPMSLTTVSVSPRSVIPVLIQ
jgi:hypothetical protein